MQAGRSSRDLPHTERDASQAPEVLRLRLVPRRKKKAVRWAEDVVDNELMNKRSSKQCCIFHKQRQFGDWDDTSDDEPCFNPEDRGQFPNTDPTGQCPQ